MLYAWICSGIYKHACAWPHGLWCWSFHSIFFCALYYPISEIFLLPIFIDKVTCVIIFKLVFPAHFVRMLSVQRGDKCCLQHSSLSFLVSWCISSVCMNNCKWYLWWVLIITSVCISVQLPASLCEHMSTNMMFASYFSKLTLPQEKDAKRGPSTVMLFQENSFYSSWILQLFMTFKILFSKILFAHPVRWLLNWLVRAADALQWSGWSQIL